MIAFDFPAFKCFILYLKSIYETTDVVSFSEEHPRVVRGDSIDF